MKKITVHASKTYDVVIDKHIICDLGKWLKEYNISGKIAIITDKNVDKLYGDKVETALSNVGYEIVKYVADGGEESKSGREYLSVLEFLSENEFTRSDVALALGGGVIGDLTGFVAGTYLRGIKFIQVPTTLLAFADSSVGGKTAINLNHGKNLVGVFNQPEAVFCDLDCIETLSEKDFSSGMAEIIKYGMIFDENLLDLIDKGMEENAEEIIARSVDLKRIVVENDERDNGERQLLNFGHTLAHAIERASNYKIMHGQAVAIGMNIITDKAVKNGVCDKQVSETLKRLLIKYNLSLNTNIPIKDLFEITRVDKKRKGDNITVVLPKKKGECYLQKLSMAEWQEFILS